MRLIKWEVVETGVKGGIYQYTLKFEINGTLTDFVELMPKIKTLITKSLKADGA